MSTAEAAFALWLAKQPAAYVRATDLLQQLHDYASAVLAGEPQEMSLHDSNSTREINGRPIHWKDKAGVVHAAEGNWLTPRDFCLWTVCGSADVPANTGYHPGDGDKVTCEACLSKQ